VPWLHCKKIAGLQVLGSVVIQLYTGKCTPSVDRALGLKIDSEKVETNRCSINEKYRV